MFETILRYIKAVLKLVLRRGVLDSYGHSGEDAVLQSMLKWQKYGTYVDVGAYHPVLYSNTYAFYKKGWRGVVIDPNEDMKPLYALMRPRDVFVHAAVGNEVTAKTYYMFKDGAYNSFDETRARSWEASRGLSIQKTRTVSFKPLSLILKEQGIQNIDFLNVDVEGMDLAVLKTHDWSIPARVIAVEDETFNPDKPHENPIYSYLSEKGYVLAGLAGLTLLFKKKEKTPS